MLNFKAFTFQGKQTAMKAFQTLEQRSPEFAWIDDVAVVLHSQRGLLRIHRHQGRNEVNENDSEGPCTDAFTGRLIEQKAEPVDTLSSAAIDGRRGMSSDMVFDDPALDDFVAVLAMNTSALVLVGEESVLADFGTAVMPMWLLANIPSFQTLFWETPSLALDSWAGAS